MRSFDFKKVGAYLNNLIKNNSGLSSKNFFLVCTTLIGLMLLIVPAIVLLVEVFTTHTVQTDLNGMAAYIGAVAGVFASAGLTKAWSEKYEKRDGHQHSMKDNEDFRE